jgi:drug/metabolite transporter (DMT)-like permease
MKTDDSNGRSLSSLKKRKPLCGVICVLFSVFSIAQVFVLSERLATAVELYICDVQPFITLGLALAAFIRKERLTWPILGILLSAFYVALHFIATA